MFLGSKGFPQRSGFDAWLAQHGGSSNAYTAEEQTVYYASVNSKALEECLERYADIFEAPLFNASWIWDEVQAVNSEHNKNRKSQEWRIQSLIGQMAVAPRGEETERGRAESGAPRRKNRDLQTHRSG
ncbi:A-factor-processing enzyme (Insulin-degrading enzyme homolog) [Durusdinium trenchii]|uniref:A-factor-processing enzyme (Insulin-degrading enzyme homolog) n=1 Tax=Durusdinium trenchii TaxID=1381693 RepID=A0ABP0KX01_9DINO